MKRPAQKRIKNFELRVKNKNQNSFLKSLVKFYIYVPVLLICFFGVGYLVAPKVHAASGINKQINFQGKLVDNNGLNVADTTYTVVFSLYTVSSGGSAIWTETDSVSTLNGVFQVSLGANTPLPGNVDFNSDTWYLGIKVNADTEMTPRVRFSAVPYAFNAAALDGIVATNSASQFTITGGTNALLDLTVNGSLTLGSTIKPTAGGALTVQSNGANGLTLDTGGAAALAIGTTANSITFGATNNPTYAFNGTGSVTFQGTSFTLGNGSSATIQTTSNAGLSLLSSGAGNITLGQNVGNGTVVVQPNAGGQASLIVVDNGSGDIFTASVGASTKFTISNTGAITDVGYAGANAILYAAPTSGVVTTTTTTTGSQCLLSQAGSSGTPIWGGCGGASASLQTAYNTGQTIDLSLAGTGLTVGTGVGNQNITFAPNAGGKAALIINDQGTGDIFTASASGTTKLVLSHAGNFGVGTITPQEELTLGPTANLAGEMASPTSVTATVQSGGTLPNATYFYVVTASDGIGETIKSTESSGCTSTNAGGGQHQCLVSWNSVVGAVSYKVYRTTTSGTYGASSFLVSQSTLNYTDTGGVALTSGTPPAGTTAYVTRFTFSGNSWLIGDNFGLGTTSPNATLHVKGGASGGNSAAIFDQVGASTNDILTGSASGTTKFRVTNSGQLNLVGGSATTDLDTLTATSLKIGTLTTNAVTLSNASATTTINGSSLTIGPTSWTATPTISGLITATLGVSVASNQSYTGAGAVTYTSANGQTLTLDSGTTGGLNIGTGANGKTITIGNSNANTALNLTTGGTGLITLGSNTGVGNILVQPNAGGQAALIINKPVATGDLFTASSSGTPKFTITNSGAASMSGSLTLDAAGTISTTKAQTLTIGDTKTGDINFYSVSNKLTSAGTLTLAGNVIATGVTASGAIAANGGITFDQSTDTIGAYTLGGTLDANSNIITNIGSTGTDFTTSGSLTIQLDAADSNGALSVDNSSQSNSIFVGKDNGTAVFTIADVSGTAADGLTFTGASSAGGGNGNAVTIAATGSDTNVPLTINSKGTGILTLDTAGAGTVTIGANATIINFGTSNTATTLAIGSGTGGDTIQIGHGTVGNGNTQTIQIGDSATGTGKDVITLGNLNGASTLTLNSGTGNIVLNAQNGIANVGIDTATPAYGLDVATVSAAFNSAQSGILKSWTTNANAYPNVIALSQTVTANGYLYTLGGYSGGSQTTVRYAKINADGSVDKWLTTTAMPEAKDDFAAVAVNGYIYVLGGETNSVLTRNTYYAKINGDGTLGSWTQAGTLPNTFSAALEVGATYYNGYIYFGGGNDFRFFTYAKINADGSLAPWQQTSDLSVGATCFNAATRIVAANGYIYQVGGANSNGTVVSSSVCYAKISQDGSIQGPIIGTRALPKALERPQVVLANGFMYVIGGDSAASGASSGVQNAVYFARLNADGSVGTWQTNPAWLPAVRYASAGVNVNGNIYVLGGSDGSSNFATIYYATTAKVSVAGDLDLLGLTSSSLASASAGLGGQIYAGNIFSNGSLEIVGNTQLWDGLSVEGAINGTGPITISGANIGHALAIFNETGNQDIFTASASGITKFTISNSGSASLSGSLTLDAVSSITTTKAQTLTLGGGSTGNILMPRFNTANGVLYISATSGQVAETGASTGTQCLITSSAGVAPSWGSCSAGSVTWDTIANPAGNKAFTMNANTTTFTYNATTGSNTNMFVLTDTTNNTGTGYIFDTETAAGSAAKPLRVVTKGNTVIDTDTNMGLTFGANAGVGTVTIQPNAGGQAALIINKPVSTGDIFTASSSGTTKFTINNSGDVVLGTTTRITNAGLGTFITGTVIGSQTFTTNNIADSGALSIKSGSTNALTLDSGASGGTVNIATGSNTTHVVFADNTSAPSTTGWSAGEFHVGDLSATGTSGRIWIRSGTNNYTFKSASANVADYSEYMAQEDPGSSEPGDVMVMTTDGSGKVAKSSSQYDEQIAGAVTTGDRGTSNNDLDYQVFDGTGSHADDPKWANVGMVGQVYVKVNMQNGPIKAGDPITTSDTPGIGMKATDPGRILGWTEQPWDGTQTRDAAAPQQSLPEGVGMVLVYIHPTWFDAGTQANLTNYAVNGVLSYPNSTINGQALSEAQNKFTITDQLGNAIHKTAVYADAMIGNLTTGSIQTKELAAESIHGEIATFDLAKFNTATISALTTDKITTTSFALTDQNGLAKIRFDQNGNGYFAGTLTADKIKTHELDGLTISVTQIDDLTGAIDKEIEKYLSVVDNTPPPPATPAAVITSTLDRLAVLGIATVSGDLRIKGDGLFEGMVHVVDTLTTNNLIVNGLSEFLDSVKFHKNVSVDGHISVLGDTAGTVTVKKGAKEADVIFANQYDYPPIVTASLMLDQENATNSALLQTTFFSQGYSYVVTNVSEKGFSLLLNKLATSDVILTWTALGRGIVTPTPE